MTLPASLAAQIAAENVPPMQDEATQIAYAERHGTRQFLGWAKESDIQIAARARMLMRDDWMHEAVCTATRDRICALWIENRELRAKLAALTSDTDGSGEADETAQQAQPEATAGADEGGIAETSNE